MKENGLLTKNIMNINIMKKLEFIMISSNHFIFDVYKKVYA